MKKLKMEDMINPPEENNYNHYTNINDAPVNDEISMMAINELLNKKKLKSISRVKFEQVPIITKLYMYSDMFKDTFTKKLADLVLELQISTNGLGRKELVQLVQQRSDMFDMVEGKKSTSKDIFR